jgi:maltose alpha-D-glucosyltransferase/alpha-amylase
METGADEPATIAGSPDPSEEGQAAYVALAHTLGLRTGQLHTALAAAVGEPSFDPEPVLPEHLGRWRENVSTDANRTLDMLQERMPQLPEGLRPEIQRLLELRELLLRRIDGLVPEELDAVMTRFHGDYHLGQVLVVHHDIQIIDFEGEQPRPSGIRWLKHLPLRDVAGMLRSFNYAAYAALFRVSAARPDDLAVLEPFALHWEEQTATSFLRGYEEGIQGCRSYPDDPEVAGNLLELFVLEKALYEVNYEINHRPDWIYIPIKGILTRLQRSSCSGTQESL